MSCDNCDMTLWHCAIKGIFSPKHFFAPVLNHTPPHQSRHFSVLEANKKLKLYCFLWPSGIVTLCEIVIRMYSSCWQIWSVRAECSEKGWIKKMWKKSERETGYVNDECHWGGPRQKEMETYNQRFFSPYSGNWFLLDGQVKETSNISWRALFFPVPSHTHSTNHVSVVSAIWMFAISRSLKKHLARCQGYRHGYNTVAFFRNF